MSANGYSFAESLVPETASPDNFKDTLDLHLSVHELLGSSYCSSDFFVSNDTVRILPSFQPIIRSDVSSKTIIDDSLGNNNNFDRADAIIHGYQECSFAINDWDSGSFNALDSNLPTSGELLSL
jgi:hypothetical protein